MCVAQDVLIDLLLQVLTIKGISDFEGAEATGCWELREFLEFDKRKQAETVGGSPKDI